MRVADLFQREHFAAKLGEVLDFHNFVLQHYFKQPAVDFQKTLDEQLTLGERIEPLVTDVTQALQALREQGANVLFEGAQGAMLDVDHGTYPFVTSSNTTAASPAPARGWGRALSMRCSASSRRTPRAWAQGPSPLSCSTSTASIFRAWATSSARSRAARRRCGWFDSVALRRAIVHSSVSGLCITKLDVLDGLDTHAHLRRLPHRRRDRRRAAAVRRQLCGGRAGLRGAAGLEGIHRRHHRLTRRLPANARDYLERLEALVKVPLDMISTGPDREQTIVLRHPFAAALS